MKRDKRDDFGEIEVDDAFSKLECDITNMVKGWRRDRRKLKQKKQPPPEHVRD